MNNIFQYKKIIDKLLLKKIVARSSKNIQLLDKLSRDEDYVIRGCVAENPNTSIHTLDKLSRDKNGWISGYVAENPTWIKYKSGLK